MSFNNTDLAAFKDVWVFCEQRQGKLMSTDYELISEGRKLADELGVKLCGLLLGSNIEGLAKNWPAMARTRSSCATILCWPSIPPMHTPR